MPKREEHTYRTLYAICGIAGGLVGSYLAHKQGAKIGFWTGQAMGYGGSAVGLVLARGLTRISSSPSFHALLSDAKDA